MAWGDCTAGRYILGDIAVLWIAATFTGEPGIIAGTSLAIRESVESGESTESEGEGAAGLRAVR